METDRQATFVMIKPDAVNRNLIGAIIQKMEAGDLKLQALKLMKMDSVLCETFYAEHKQKPFFSSLTQYILSGPVVVMALSGAEPVKKARQIIGHTDPAKALPGTIRALYGQSIEQNSIHGSDSTESAERELSLFFKEKQWQV